MQITFEQLKKIFLNIPDSAKAFVPYLNEYMNKYEINTNQRIACFIAQIAHESGQFKYVKEISNGSQYDIGKLAKILGNTPQDDNDGERLKGRGLIQVTGKIAYLECSKFIFGDDRLLKQPELLEQPQYAVQSACWKWVQIKGNSLSDLPNTWRSKTKNYSPFQYITYRINGGQNGYAERLKYYQQAKKILIS